MQNSLIKKYNVPGPRYTSYPTVPFWQKERLTQEEWFASIRKNQKHFNSQKASLYIHLPYCESLCTFCGCHKRITKNHAVELPYIDALLQEFSLYHQQFDFKIQELHLGGGTPTFFSPESLEILLTELTKFKAEQFDFSFEAHPNNTSQRHLQLLYDFGFRRLSLGVQDYDETVQQAIHRFQTFEKVKEVHQLAKEMGYTSISHDLVYGLPKQKLCGLIKTVQKTLTLRPERISLYSYAHVPWMKGNGQRGFDENDLPDNEEKRNLYETAKELFLKAGYIEIGMDHFALPTDDLALAFPCKNLHRNFMGYTTQNTNLLLGLGASAISDSWFAFAQNPKSIEAYLEQVKSREFQFEKGHLLSEDDLFVRRQILDLMCHFETKMKTSDENFYRVMENLEPLFDDELVAFDGTSLRVKNEGLPFVRNVCMAFDSYLTKTASNEKMFSKTI